MTPIDVQALALNLAERLECDTPENIPVTLAMILARFEQPIRQLEQERDGLQADVAQLSNHVDGWVQRSQEHERHLSNLLAILHRDGGHYEGQHGTAKAVEDAKAVYYRAIAAEAQLAASQQALGWAYQYAGFMDASEEILDNLSAVAQGRPAPHEWPQASDESRALYSERFGDIDCNHALAEPQRRYYTRIQQERALSDKLAEALKAAHACSIRDGEGRCGNPECRIDEALAEWSKARKAGDGGVHTKPEGHGR